MYQLQFIVTIRSINQEVKIKVWIHSGLCDLVKQLVVPGALCGMLHQQQGAPVLVDHLPQACHDLGPHTQHI